MVSSSDLTGSWFSNVRFTWKKRTQLIEGTSTTATHDFFDRGTSNSTYIYIDESGACSTSDFYESSTKYRFKKRCKRKQPRKGKIPPEIDRSYDSPVEPIKYDPPQDMPPIFESDISKRLRIEKRKIVY